VAATVVADERRDEEVTEEPKAPFRLGSWWYRVLSLALYGAIACWLYGFDILNNSRIVDNNASDQAQEVWFLGWPAYALRHWINPFQSDWMNHPYGINLMTNTSMPLLGFIGAPITWLFGPVTTYMVLMRLAMVLSAASAQFVARRVGLSRPAALFAGLLYGFSTIQITQGNGHLFLVFCPLPPLIFYGAYCLAIERWSPLRSGVTIGALFAADFLISAERALMTAIVLVIAAFVALVFCLRAISWRLLSQIALGTLIAGVVALAILAIPIIEMTGHGHVSGAAHPWIQSYETDLVAIVFPTAYTFLHVVHYSFAHGLNVQAVENGAYLGIPLIVLVLFAAVRGFGNRLVRVGFVSTVIVLGISMGEVLKINGRKTTFHSPYKLFTKVNYIQNILPVRFMYFVWIGVALLGAFGLDLIIRGRGRGAHRKRPLLRYGIAAVVAGAVLFSLAPAGPYLMVPTAVPQWLMSPEAAATIPVNSVVLYYPYPLAESNHSLINQSDAAFHYKIIGGQAIVGDENGRSVGIVPLAPLDLPSVFIRSWDCLGTPPAPNLPCLESRYVPPHDFYLPPMPPLNQATTNEFRQFVVLNHVSTILMEFPTSPQAAYAMKYLTMAFGQPLHKDNGQLNVWTKAMLHWAIYK
jgi:hypothetical protein